ncbi:queuine tRNA-ribosyltransferase [Mycobacterium phage Indlovu]|nr:queuine tRNA-ribosyltransferase [Mycobacterium phage Indlovu]
MTLATELHRLDVKRVASPDEASLCVGDMVPAREPSDIKPGTVIHDADTGEPVLGYLALNDPGPLRRALLQIDCGPAVQRANNYRSRSRTFGYAPRRPVIWREACGIATLGRDRPDIEAVLESYADQFMDGLARIDMRLIRDGRAATESVTPDWKMGGSQFWTSGVVNDTAQLPYHRDGFNFPVWSAMPLVRRGTRGGHLHLPEYDLVVPCADATVTYFEGFRLVHGVTPITRVKAKQGYRISAVYYALRGMKNCRTAAEEAAYGRRRRTEREAEMAARLAAGDRSIPGQSKG